MNEQFNELLLQALETEMGGVQVYQAALNCGVNDDLKKSGKSISNKPTTASRYYETCVKHSVLTRRMKRRGVKSSATLGSRWSSRSRRQWKAACRKRPNSSHASAWCWRTAAAG
jgi:hypothetical protein